MGKRELIALLNLSSWCLVVVERLFLAVPRGCLQFVIVVFPDHTHLLFLVSLSYHLSLRSLFTVNSEMFARTLSSRNFAYAKFRENKTFAKWQNHSCHLLI